MESWPLVTAKSKLYREKKKHHCKHLHQRVEGFGSIYNDLVANDGI